MAAKIQPVEYFYATVRARPGEAYRLLSQLATSGVNLLAFSAIPIGPEHTQLVLFPEKVELFNEVAKERNISITGPQCALLIQGDDELGAFGGILGKLFDARCDVYAATGVTDGRGGYGYVLYVRPEDFEDAAKALGVQAGSAIHSC